jgi:hypothetical protein
LRFLGRVETGISEKLGRWVLPCIRILATRRFLFEQRDADFAFR